MIIIATLIVYFICLLCIAHLTVKHSSNANFFTAKHSSPWYMVAFGMIGASVSGVTFVSVPGMVLTQQMTYLQTCMGFILGYFVVAYILLPIYKKAGLTSIYTFLQNRFGNRSYTTGACFFLLSKITGASIKFYVVCLILQRFVLDTWHVPFVVTVTVLVLCIWLYTRRGGIRTLVWTDSFQTLCMIASLVVIMLKAMSLLHMDAYQTVQAISSNPLSKIFEFNDWHSTQNFFKQFISGIFIVIVMTGLDQDMMQKNLTCKTLKDAQKDMCSYGFAFLPINFLLLALGILLVMFSTKSGIALPANSDELMLKFTAGGLMGPTVTVLFTIGIVAACFSSADSALTSLTTCYCIDIRRQPDNERLRKCTHFVMCIIFILFILLFNAINNDNLINAVYTLVSYTYGPLLGLFGYGILCRKPVDDKLVPYIAVASPLICWLLQTFAEKEFQYKFGYELLMLNGMITATALWLTRKLN